MIRGTTRVPCPQCGTEADCTLVQTIDTRENPDDKTKLLAGELNVLACTSCGRRTQLGVQVLYVDRRESGDLYIQVCPGGDKAVEQGAIAFAASGVSGTLRVVPSLNALVEKVKIADAGLADWAIEMTKVLLLASINELDRVLLFDALDGDTIRWLLLDGAAVEPMASTRANYDKLSHRDAPRDLLIDRAWAVPAVQHMIENAN